MLSRAAPDVTSTRTFSLVIPTDGQPPSCVYDHLRIHSGHVCWPMECARPPCSHVPHPPPEAPTGPHRRVVLNAVDSGVFRLRYHVLFVHGLITVMSSLSETVSTARFQTFPTTRFTFFFIRTCPCNTSALTILSIYIRTFDHCPSRKR